jgi:hypothetical protein
VIENKEMMESSLNEITKKDDNPTLAIVELKK